MFNQNEFMILNTITKRKRYHRKNTFLIYQFLSLMLLGKLAHFGLTDYIRLPIQEGRKYNESIV